MIALPETAAPSTGVDCRSTLHEVGSAHGVIRPRRDSEYLTARRELRPSGRFAVPVSAVSDIVTLIAMVGPLICSPDAAHAAGSPSRHADHPLERQERRSRDTLHLR